MIPSEHSFIHIQIDVLLTGFIEDFTSRALIPLTRNLGIMQVEQTGMLSNLRDQSTYRTFPEDDLDEILTAIETVPDDIIESSTHGHELRALDDSIADSLQEYAYEHKVDHGRNPACKLWSDDGFDHSVDLYHPDKRIAIEIEKSERKRVSDDILKFIKGGKTQRRGRKKIEFGCLIVPINYRGNGNIFAATMNTLAFMRSIMFVEYVAVLGYRDPRW